MSEGAGARPLLPFQIGRPFLHPVLDVLLIGGGLSLLLVPLAALAAPGRSADSLLTFLPALFLVSNSAHFAASTVRLYTKEDSFRALPFLTMTFPLVSLAVASLAILFPEGLGRHLVALFLIWSPFHYSAQAYGLAVMYCYRSGARLSDRQKRLLRLACMMTFFKTAIGVPELGIGIWWLLPWSAVSESALARPILDAAVAGLGVLAFGLPVALLLETRRSGSPLPLISLLIVITNALWFFGFKYLNGLSWATVFHGVQYLAIATIFHVKDKMRAPGNRRGVLYHTLWFYGASLALGYLIFRCWPSAYMMLGFGYVESSIMVVAVINLHHFIVDAYIWRLRKDPNYKNVAEARAGEPAVAPVAV
jgi:hypothetical protein